MIARPRRNRELEMTDSVGVDVGGGGGGGARCVKIDLLSSYYSQSYVRAAHTSRDLRAPTQSASLRLPVGRRY